MKISSLSIWESKERLTSPLIFIPLFVLLQLSTIQYHTKPLSTFHQINAFEENGFLVMDMCCSDDGKAINNYMIQNLRKSGEALDEVKHSIGLDPNEPCS